MVRGQKASPPHPWNLSQIFYSDENWHNIPYLKKTKNIYESCDTPLEFCWHQHFFPEISKFCCIKNYRHRLHFDTQFLILLTFLESLKVALINIVTILMISAKLATPDLLEIKVFRNKSYKVITSVHDITNKILSRDSNYIVDVVKV